MRIFLNNSLLPFSKKPKEKMYKILKIIYNICTYIKKVIYSYILKKKVCLFSDHYAIFTLYKEHEYNNNKYSKSKYFLVHKAHSYFF